jgi:hypothetical protein
MRKTLTAITTAFTLLLAPAFLSSIVLADEEATPLLKQSLEGMDGMEANVVLFNVEPGFETERHIHPGHLFIYVLEGEIEIDVEGQARTDPHSRWQGCLRTGKHADGRAQRQFYRGRPLRGLPGRKGR